MPTLATCPNLRYDVAHSATRSACFRYLQLCMGRLKWGCRLVRALTPPLHDVPPSSSATVPLHPVQIWLPKIPWVFKKLLRSIRGLNFSTIFLQEMRFWFSQVKNCLKRLSNMQETIFRYVLWDWYKNNSISVHKQRKKTVMRQF